MAYSVSFDLIINEIKNGVRYFLHIMKRTKTMGGYTKFIIVSSKESYFYVTTPQNEFKDIPKLKENQWMNIKISQRNTKNGYKIVIYVDHVKVVETNNGNPSVHDYLKVFACGEGSPQIGMIQNLYINGKSYVCCINIFPLVPY